MKKLLTLLLVAAIAVASFGVLTACGDKSGGTSGDLGGVNGDDVVTTSSTIEGEWYCKIDDYLNKEAACAQPDEELPQMPVLSAELSVSIKKLADDEKVGGFVGMDYVAVGMLKYNVSEISLSSAEREWFINENGPVLLGDGNLYDIIGPFAFTEPTDVNEDEGWEIVPFPFGKAVYKDDKLHVFVECNDSPMDESDWYYRALGTNPDVAGTWTGTGDEYVGAVTVKAVTEGPDKNVIFVGRYAIVPWKDVNIQVQSWGLGDPYGAVLLEVSNEKYIYLYNTVHITKQD